MMSLAGFGALQTFAPSRDPGEDRRSVIHAKGIAILSARPITSAGRFFAAPPAGFGLAVDTGVKAAGKDVALPLWARNWTPVMSGWWRAF